jgi:hypothetical protein
VSQHIRRTLIEKDPIRAMESLLEALGKSPDNAAYVANFNARGFR